MFCACQRLISLGSVRRDSAIARVSCRTERFCGACCSAAGFEANHRALHALVGGVAEEVAVEGDVIDLRASQKAGDLGGVEGIGFEGATQGWH